MDTYLLVIFLAIPAAALGGWFYGYADGFRDGLREIKREYQAKKSGAP